MGRCLAAQGQCRPVAAISMHLKHVYRTFEACTARSHELATACDAAILWVFAACGSKHPAQQTARLLREATSHSNNVSITEQSTALG